MSELTVGPIVSTQLHTTPIYEKRAEAPALQSADKLKLRTNLRNSTRNTT